jgi:hypothetical protein
MNPYEFEPLSLPIEAREHEPPATVALLDAKLRTRQALAAVVAAAPMAPDRAADLARCHALLADARELLERVQ